MNNLFIEIGNNNNNTDKKGKSMNSFKGTLFELESNIAKKIRLYNDAIKYWNSEVYNLSKRDPNSEYSYSILKFADGEEFTETVVTTAGERKDLAAKCVAGASAEVNRLDYAAYLIRKEAATADPFDQYRLVEGALVNTEENYPSQSYEALRNSASLLKLLTYEIRNVICEKNQAPLYIKKRAGYLMRDAKTLLSTLESMKDSLATDEFKLGYSLVKEK